MGEKKREIRKEYDTESSNKQLIHKEHPLHWLFCNNLIYNLCFYKFFVTQLTATLLKIIHDVQITSASWKWI